MEIFTCVLGILFFVAMNFSVATMMTTGIYDAIDPAVPNRMLVAVLYAVFMLVSYVMSGVIAYLGAKHISDVIAEKKAEKQRKAEEKAFWDYINRHLGE